MIAIIRGLILLGILGCAPASGAAQTAPTSETASQSSAPPAQPRVVVSQDGFAVESGNGDFRLQIGLLVHADGRFALGDDNEQYVDNFSIRRVRPYLRGRIARRFEFYFNPDFASGTLVLQDAYIDTVFSPAFRVRAGKGKTPFGFERLQSASNILFMERAFPTALVPNRDIGVQVLGDISDGVVSYLAGVMNGVADGGSADVDNNDGKDVSGRVIVRPFTKRADAALRGLGVGLSGSRGAAAGVLALPVLRTQTLQQPYFSYAITGNNPVTADGTRYRYSPQLWYFRKAFGGWAEYVKTTMPLRRGDVTGDVDHEAWQVAASWVLTGENATDAGIGVRPRRNFDFGAGGWGAFQVAARYHFLQVDDRAFALGFAATGASRKAEGYTVGLRWYATGNLWYTLNFERTVFDGDPGGPRPAENGRAFRTQVNF